MISKDPPIYSSKDPPIYPNSYEKLTKIEIMSSSSHFEHCSKITHLTHWKSYLVIICPNSHEKLTKSEIRSNCLLQFGFIYPYLAPKYRFSPYLALLTYIYLYLSVFRLICAYLPLIALILPYVPYSPYICFHLLRLHLCAKF